jgi:hypothetical protein
MFCIILARLKKGRSIFCYKISDARTIVVAPFLSIFAFYTRCRDALARTCSTTSRKGLLDTHLFSTKCSGSDKRLLRELSFPLSLITKRIFLRP